MTKDVTKKYNYPIEVYEVENRGRDVLPFLKVLPKVIEDGNEFILKVHTKKSLHRADGDKWRQELYAQLLSFPMYVRALRYFEEDQDLAMVAPDGSLAPLSYYWGSNRSNVLSLCNGYGVNFEKNKNCQFVAGTMFIARSSMFKKLLLNKRVNAESFEDECGQVDGTVAHAYERFFGIYSNNLNFRLTTYTNKMICRSWGCQWGLE